MTDIKQAIDRSISHTEIVRVDVLDMAAAEVEVSTIADECDSCSGVERGDTTGTDIWGTVDGSDFRLFLARME